MDGEAARGRYSAEKLAQIPALLQRVVDAGDISGFVTLVWRDGEVVQVDTVGRRNLEAGLPMTRDTLFRIASMTKPIVSAAALMLMEQGKLSLTDPITRWAPEFADMRVLRDLTSPLDAADPAPRDITIEDLLTHRSGLSYNFNSQEGPVAYAYHKELGSPVVSPHAPDEWMRRLGALPLLYAPGDRFHYGHSTDVLGFIVGRVMGRSLGDALKALIFDPLGMTDTAFWVEPERQERMARIYRRNPDGSFRDDSYGLTPAPAAWEGGGGGLISKADDYLTFARMLMGEGEVGGVRLLKPETVALMRTNRLTAAQRQIPFFGTPIWSVMGFGLGLSTVMNAQIANMVGATSEGAFGWPGAFGTWWQGDPATNTILLYLIQESATDFEPRSDTATTAAAVMGGRTTLPAFQKAAYAALGI
jgi:CubicO group peptidase (beta-lactamase class C family)